MCLNICKITSHEPSQHLSSSSATQTKLIDRTIKYICLNFPCFLIAYHCLKLNTFLTILLYLKHSYHYVPSLFNIHEWYYRIQPMLLGLTL